MTELHSVLETRISQLVGSEATSDPLSSYRPPACHCLLSYLFEARFITTDTSWHFNSFVAMLDVLLPARSITSRLFKLCHRPDAFSELESTTGLADEASPRGYRERKGDSFEEKVNDVGDYHGDLGLESGRGSDVKLRDLRKLMKEESVDI